MKKKYIFIILCAILISIVSMRVTVAYLTDVEKTSNTYTIGKVSITLDETDVDELGVPIEGANRVYENEYHLMPGYTYVKDPTVTMLAGSNDSYVRILVTINKIEELNTIFGNDFKPEEFINGWNNEIWKYINVINNGDNSNTYEFRYYEMVNGYSNDEEISKKLEPLFKSFMVPGSINNEQLEMIKDLEISIIGQAIQAEGFGNNADDAWNAFEIQFGEE